jgi:acyl-CoA synthetase (AMP-forming)/AMP-acid ligase II
VPILGRLEKSLLQFRNFLRAIAHGVGLKSILLGIETRNEISDTSLPLRDAKLVRGYFQNPGVSNQTLETLRDGLFPKDGNLSHLVQAEIFIHYRRGDYTSHKQSIGLLDDMYFVGAAKSARSATGIIRVRIFSDGDPNELKIRLEEIGFIVEVFEDGGLDPFEALSTLVSSRGPLITSNSSFSWWAAALSEADRLVFYPMPWFRDGSLHDMGRKGWTSLEHDWSD